MERDLYRAERRMRRDGDNPSLRKEVEDLRKQIADLKKEAGPEVAMMNKPPAHEVNGDSSCTPVFDGS